MKLSEVIDGLNAGVLKALAKQLNLSRDLTRKADLARELQVQVDLHLEALLGRLSDTERLFLAEVAVRVAHDRHTKTLCHLAGERYLAVPEKNEQAFRKAIKKLGYVLPR